VRHKKLEILYLSNVCSQNTISHLFKTLNVKPAQEAQKFHKLLIEGFAAHSDTCKIETLSVIPVISSNKKKVWSFPSEKVGNIFYNYVPIINLPFIKDLIVFVYSFYWIFHWFNLNRGKDKVIICDALKLSISSAAIIACKLFKVKVVGIITDLPDLLVGSNQNPDLKYKIYKRLSYLIISNFDKYIILTLQMNEVVNRRHKPYIVMEGLVDIKMKRKDSSLIVKDSNRILLYAGGIYEEYGVKRLLDAFKQLNGENLRLHIFGAGEMKNEMLKYMELDKRIIYKGVVPNNEVVEAELKATLLINPRPTEKDFTKFSFPSKNMEYMVSGTPIITTKLPGMPLEYYKHVYLFEDESVNGMTTTLKTLLLKSESELIAFGRKAQEFVLNNKSNLIQARRILNFLEN
jgi:glycosyltransferase involved in cell wall biosynthesis